MNCKVSHICLCYNPRLSSYTVSPLPLEKGVSGAVYCSLSREDLAILFPHDDQFLMGVRLYKHIQDCRMHQPSVSDIEESASNVTVSNATQSTHAVTLTSTPSDSSTVVLNKSRKRSSVPSEFVLPEFSIDVVDAIQKDSFFTAAKRNKLIREACKAYKGYCRMKGQSVTNQDKRNLSQKLYNLAPKSLGDPVAVGVQGQLYVSSLCEFLRICMLMYVYLTYRQA